MSATFEQRLRAIPWGDFGTAYGPAVAVPDQLRRLSGLDRKAAMDSTHDLWCGLCHQHVQVSSAALPALPFLLEVLDRADRDMTVELLDILLGFALGVGRQHSEISSLGRDAIHEQHWIADLRAGLLAEVPRLHRLADSSDDEVADFAGRIMAELVEAPDGTPGATPDAVV